MSTSAPLRLTHLSFDHLWSILDLGAFPVVLQLRSHGLTMPEREQLFADDAGHLTRIGVLDREGEVHPQVTAMLRALARPDREVDARATSREGGLRLLCGTRDGRGALAVRTDETVTLTPVRAGAEASAVITALPAHRPAPTAQVSGRSDVVEAALALLHTRPDEAVTAFLALQTPLEQARSLVTSLRSVFAMVQLGSAVRDAHGHRQRHPRVVAILDGEQGRLVTSQRPGLDRQPWTTVRSAGPRDVQQAVDAMLPVRPEGVLRPR